MKKSHSYNEMSETKCGCGKPLKQRIVETKKAPKCYGCYKVAEAKRGHKVDSASRKKRVAAGLPVKEY